LEYTYTQENLPTALPINHVQLLSCSKHELDYWLSKFIYEVRNTKGERYPRNTLISLVAGLNVMFNVNSLLINLLKDSEFVHFRSVLDLVCKESAREGVGCHKKQAEVISESEEQLLW